MERKIDGGWIILYGDDEYLAPQNGSFYRKRRYAEERLDKMSQSWKNRNNPRIATVDLILTSEDKVEE